MRLALIGAWGVAIVLVCQPSGYAIAIASASGGIGDGGDIGEDNIGYPSISAHYDSSDEPFTYDFYQADASVNGGKLKAYAHVILNQEWGSVRARAQATWDDALLVGNPDLVDHGAYLYFRPQFKGKRTGTTSNAQSEVILSHPVSGDAFAEHYGNTGNGTDLDAELIVPLFYFLAPVSYHISLIASAGRFGTPGIADANYSHTAYLPPIFVGDVNGNPMPALAGLQIVGVNGWQYPVTVVQRTVGDYDGNGVVGAGDYVVWRKSVGQTGLVLNADGNGDKVVDDEDYGVWLANIGNTMSSPGQGAGKASLSGIPEPTSAALLSAGMLVCIAASRHRRCQRN